MKHTSQSLQNILSHPNGDLGKILQAVKTIQTLNERLQNELPDNLRKHVQVTNLSQGKLFLEVSNSSVASKLHYFKSDLLHRLRKLPEFAHLKSSADIEYRIAQKAQATKVKQPEPSDFQLSLQASETLLSCIESTSDKKLKSSLKKFLKHYG
ncbi:MAG: hypothetical protein K0S29_1382, partial [Gammaproteobacteria bacterium]|nr:hypothetical protein [Gammaproteobacteria bacterium]